MCRRWGAQATRTSEGSLWLLDCGRDSGVHELPMSRFQSGGSWSLLAWARAWHEHGLCAQSDRVAGSVSWQVQAQLPNSSILTRLRLDKTPGAPQPVRGRQPRTLLKPNKEVSRRKKCLVISASSYATQTGQLSSWTARHLSLVGHSRQRGVQASNHGVTSAQPAARSCGQLARFT